MKLFTLSTNCDTMKPWLAVVVEIVWSSKKTLAGVAVMWYNRSGVLAHLLEHDQLWRL